MKKDKIKEQTAERKKLLQKITGNPPAQKQLPKTEAKQVILKSAAQRPQNVATA